MHTPKYIISHPYRARLVIRQHLSCCEVAEVLLVNAVARVNQREKQNSADASNAGHDANPVRQRLMHMLGLTMPPRTASTATQTAVNSLRSAGTQTEQASTSSTMSSYRFTHY